jgi:RNA polymerase sigma-70 factor (ECF subfamily)
MSGPPTRDSLHLAFPSTHWTVIRAGADPEARKESLALLARAYWRPIHAFLRRALGRSREDALDLTQDFFVWTIESGFLEKADPARGRFRAFLKTALHNYVANADGRKAALKRGGGARFVPLALDDDDGEARVEPADVSARTPDELLDDAWKAQVVQSALERVQKDLERDGRAVAWAVFRDWFLEPSPHAAGAAVDHKRLAERHGITLADVSNHLQRTKHAYRSALRALVQETVGSGADLEDEMAWLVGKERA